jgi:hypothetical protein
VIIVLIRITRKESIKPELFKKNWGSVGMTPSYDAELLRKIILEGIIKADATEQKPTLYGRRFRVDFEVERGQQFVLLKAVVRTAWIIRNDESFPRLTTCFTPRRSR